MDLFATLVLAHLIADFPLQTQWIYQFKTRSPAGVALHTAIHLAVTAALIRNPLDHWPLLACLGAAHYLTDWLKLRFLTTTQTTGFLLDQAAHLAAMGLLALASLSGRPMWAGVGALLPPELLYPAIAYALAPAAMTFLWVLANDRPPSGLRTTFGGLKTTFGGSAWAGLQVLTLSKLAGLPLVMAIAVERLLSGQL